MKIFNLTFIFLSFILIADKSFAERVCYPITMSFPDRGTVVTESCLEMPDPPPLPPLPLPPVEIPDIHDKIKTNLDFFGYDNLPKIPNMPNVPEPNKIPDAFNFDLDKLLAASNGPYGIDPQSHNEFVQMLRDSGTKIDLDEIKDLKTVARAYEKFIPLEAEKLESAKISNSTLTQGVREKVSSTYLFSSIKQIESSQDGFSSKITQNSSKVSKLIRDDKSERDDVTFVHSEFGINETISWKSQNAQVLRDGYIKLNDFAPTTEVEFELKTTGLTSIRLADAAYVDGDVEAGDFYRNLGLGLADALVGLDMVSGVVRDTYEAVTGKSLITGEELDDFSRGFAVLGVVTFSLGSKIGKGVNLLRKICKDERLLENAGKIAQKFNAITGFRFENRIGREKLQDFAKTTKSWDALAWNTFPKVSSELRLSEKQLSKEASRLGISPEELAIKRETAIGFYNNTEKFNGKSKRIESHLNGIDFSGPVEVTKIPRGTVVESWSIPGEKLGDYVALERTSPGSLGTDSLGMGKDGMLYSKIPKKYIATEDVPALKSKAADIFDTWSWEKQNPEKVPHPIFENRAIKTTGNYQPGGADQYLIQKSTFKELD